MSPAVDRRVDRQRLYPRTGDPPQDPGSAVHHGASRRDPPGRRSSPPCDLGGDCAEHVLHHFERRGRRTTVHVGRSTLGAPGRGGRSRGRRPARRPAMQTPRPGTCVGQRGMPRTLPARPRRWAMWRPTSWVPRHTRSGRCERQRLRTRARRPAAWNASGSAPNSPRDPRPCARRPAAAQRVVLVRVRLLTRPAAQVPRIGR